MARNRRAHKFSNGRVSPGNVPQGKFRGVVCPDSQREKNRLDWVTRFCAKGNSSGMRRNKFWAQGGRKRTVDSGQPAEGRPLEKKN